MITTSSRKWSVKKKLLLSLLAIVIILAGVYFYIATEKFSSTKDRTAAFTVNAIDLIREFRQNDSASNNKYQEKIIAVNGIVSELEAPDTSTFNIKFIDSATGDYLIFAFQDQFLQEAKTVKVGDNISVKGSCSGVVFSEILETYYISFKRSTLNNTN